MPISNQSLILIITTLAAAAVGLCYLPIVSDIVLAITARQKEKRLTKQSARQLEQKMLSYHQEVLDKMGERFRMDAGIALKRTEEILVEQLGIIRGEHSGSLSQLSAAIKSDYEKNRQELKTSTNNYLNETKIALHGVVEDAEKRVNDKLTKELEATLTELKDYKEGRLKKIDDEIATIVEKTIYLTLGKTLSPQDHLDIIYESLAEAKEKGFFGKNAG